MGGGVKGNLRGGKGHDTTINLFYKGFDHLLQKDHFLRHGQKMKGVKGTLYKLMMLRLVGHEMSFTFHTIWRLSLSPFLNLAFKLRGPKVPLKKVGHEMSTIFNFCNANPCFCNKFFQNKSTTYDLKVRDTTIPRMTIRRMLIERLFTFKLFLPIWSQLHRGQEKFL